MDDQKGFLGALDRWNFKLLGKKEKYITYNNYTLFDRKACPTAKQLATKNFVNPDCVRWELHRVCVVEATLKPGLRHIYKRRVFFWDEDTPGAGVAENYDAGGQLYRLISNVSYPFYEAPGGVGGLGGSGFVNTDLQTVFAAASMSIAGSIRELRLQRCRDFLRNPSLQDRSVAEVATLWGFGNLSNFSRAYKARFCITPQQEKRS